MKQDRRRLPPRPDWLAVFAADAAARADALASVIAAAALEHPDDAELIAWCAAADRLARDNARIALELDDDGPAAIHTRSRPLWAVA